MLLYIEMSKGVILRAGEMSLLIICILSARLTISKL